LRNRKIWFGTNNKGKLEEVKAILTPYKITTKHLPMDKVEIQAETLEEVVRYCLETLEFKRPLVIEDSGLFIESLNGFPGPYSRYVLDTINLPGILKLLKEVENREACFRSVIGFKEDTTIKVFKGCTCGKIAFEERGFSGFGYDPIFIPNEEPSQKTYGELTLNSKNSYSHRAKSFKNFAEWLTSDY
jgi:XTP/dITP diphosphohydrolase